MTTAIDTLPERAIRTEDVFYQLTVEQYHQLIEAEVLVGGDPVELVEGVLLYKMTQKPRHPVCLWHLQHQLEPLVPRGFFYSQERAITLDDGEPEPDGAVFRGSVNDYVDRHPGPADVELVIEVADTSLRRDRGTKLRSYARAGIACYWIVNLIDRCVEVHHDPQPADNLAHLPQPNRLHRNRRGPGRCGGQEPRQDRRRVGAAPGDDSVRTLLPSHICVSQIGR